MEKRHSLAKTVTLSKNNLPSILSRLAMDRTADSKSPEQITELLQSWGRGDHAAFDQLAPIVYAELRRLARHYMARERPDHTLQPTALVHEAYMRLADFRSLHWKNRIQFFAIS